MILDKFLPPFIDFMDENFGRGEHKYVFITSEKYNYGLTPEHNVEFLYTDDDIFIILLGYMKKARKIILHGLWRDKVNQILYDNKELLKKCYWAMWGGDFYFPEKHSKIKKEIMKNIRFCLTQLKDDYEYIKKYYNIKGTVIYLKVGYPSNLYKTSKKIAINQCEKTKFLVGNSATETNNHQYIFQKLKKYEKANVEIISPLSYGDVSYASLIQKKGQNIFGSKFLALTEMLSIDKYTELLSSIDIAIFAHDRQQAIGNIMTLLGLGKKVYIKKNIATWSFLQQYNLKVFDIEQLDLKKMKIEDAEFNIGIMKRNFSYKELINDCKKYLN